jgi:uncharacterized protein YcbK (DUF882 family)
MLRLLAAVTVSACVLGTSSSGAVAAGQPTGCLPASLKKELSIVRERFGKVTIVSTYRPGARIAGSGHRSKHADCRAVDFEVRNKSAAFRWLDKVHRGGLGNYYGPCNHLHIDDGPNARWHRNYCG